MLSKNDFVVSFRKAFLDDGLAGINLVLLSDEYTVVLPINA